MRIVIDLQSAQYLGVDDEQGQIFIKFANAIAANASEHEILIVLNGVDYRSIESIKAAFGEIISPDRVRIWIPPSDIDILNENQNILSELSYEAFLKSLFPDVVIITHLFAGLSDRFVSSIGQLGRERYLSCVFLNEIPDHNSASSFNTEFLKWRERKLAVLRKADLCLITSEPMKKTLIEKYEFVHGEVIDISSDKETLLPNGKAVVFALEAEYNKAKAASVHYPQPRQSLAYVSPLPLTASGIAEYSAILAPELCRHYDIDLIATEEVTGDIALESNCKIRSAEWFEENAHHYDRIVYHFGNSGYHSYMLELIKRHPGVVVLHDFYLGHLLAIPDRGSSDPVSWRRLLRDMHGYKAVADSLSTKTHQFVLWKYPVNAGILGSATGVIVHSEHARTLAKEWYGRDYANNWHVIPLIRRLQSSTTRQEARARLGYKEEDYLVCSFGAIGDTKKNLEALKAWAATSLSAQKNCCLCFVGWTGGADYMEQICDSISGMPHSRIKIIGDADAKMYEDYLCAADCAIQLRTRSRGETSAAALDCLAYGIPLIINANGSMKEIPSHVASILDDDFTVKELSAKIEELFLNHNLRLAYSEAARNYMRSEHSPRRIAELYRRAIEEIYSSNQQSNIRRQLIEKVGRLQIAGEVDLQPFAEAVVINHRSRPAQRRIFVDITEVAKNDLKTGVERVVRNILTQAIDIDLDDFIVAPVYFDGKGRWRHASQFMGNFYLGGYAGLRDEVVDMFEDDIFVMLDLTYLSLIYFPEKFEAVRGRGTRLFFCVYDILPIKLPQFFPPEAFDVFTARLDRMASFADGLICISQTVAQEVYDYLRSRGISRRHPLAIGWFRLGSDIMTVPVQMPPVGEHQTWLHTLMRKSFVLMVGTVEPRKGHAEVLSAFELLWAEGNDLSLVICGKGGWIGDDFLARIRKHSEFGKRLFWFEGASDYTLRELYTNCEGVLLASEGEGFGLPLVEAGAYGKPILARDLPVFREVAEDSASYFSGGPVELSKAIENWSASISSATAPDSRNIPVVSWRESADQFMSLVMSEDNERWIFRVDV